MMRVSVWGVISAAERKGEVLKPQTSLADEEERANENSRLEEL